ncbi:MAG: hypothetical protein AAGJ37_00595 [Pseudomonadota bacterium]
MLKKVLLILLVSCSAKLLAKDAVSIFSLLTTDESSGKVIQTSGYIAFTPDGVFLYPYESDASSQDYTREIAVLLPIETEIRVRENCDDSVVLITGRFFNDDPKSRVFRQITEVRNILMLNKNKGQENFVDCLRLDQ